MLLVSLLFFGGVVSSSLPGLPSICFCGDSTSQNASSLPGIRQCLYRSGIGSSFHDCPTIFKSNVKFATSDGTQMTCSCALGFPSSCSKLSCFATFSLSGSAMWAFVFDEFSPGRVIDANSELEYLYGDNSQLLIQYQSSDGLFATDIRRHDGGINQDQRFLSFVLKEIVSVPVGDQVFWYGLSPIAEVLWTNARRK